MYGPHEHRESVDGSSHAESPNAESPNAESANAESPKAESPNAESFHRGQNSIFGSQSSQKARGWVFSTRKADIVVMLAMLLATGLGTMWLISQLPFLLEAASARYFWAKELYATWGTPSMRWLFINLVVGVIVATSGLLSAFGGDGGQEAERAGYDKGRVYGLTQINSYSLPETRFSGVAYNSAVFNPYIDEIKPGSLHESSFGSWNHGAQEQILGREPQEEISVTQDSVKESNAVEADVSIPELSADTMPVLGEVTLSSEMPTQGELQGEILREIPREIITAGELPSSWETPSSREVSMSVDKPLSRELSSPMPIETQLPEAARALVQITDGESSEGNTGEASSASEVEIMSNVFDPIADKVDTPKRQEPRRMQTGQSLPSGPVKRTALDNFFAKPDALSKSHTFTVGRVIRRDQFADFIEPLSKKLEGKPRTDRLDPVRSFKSEFVPPVIPRRIERFCPEPFPGTSPPAPLPRLTSTPGSVTHPVTFTSNAVSPPVSPILRQRSIVYPPALISQASIASNDTSPPPSPPMEEAIPPPPPPHLKLPPGLQGNSSSSITSSEDMSSSKSHVHLISQPTSLSALTSVRPREQPFSGESMKQISHRHSKSGSAFIPSSGISMVGPDTESSSAQVEQSSMLKSRRSSASEPESHETSDGSVLNRQDGSMPKDDDLHQQIEDFLARFHENWRLQRQESLARYKKRLVELDEGSQ